MINSQSGWSSPRVRVAIAGLALLLLAVPAVLVIRSDLLVIDRVQREQAGLGPAWDVLLLMQVTQRHRGLSNATMAGSTALIEQRTLARGDVDRCLVRLAESGRALGSSMLDERIAGLAHEWQALISAVDSGTISANESFRSHSLLIRQQLSVLDEIRNGSGLPMHAEPFGYHLQMAALEHLPRVAEGLGQLRGDGSRLLTLGTASRADRARLASYAGEVRDRLDSVRKSFDLALETGKNTDRRLGRVAAATNQATVQALDLAETGIVRAEHLSLSESRYFADMTTVIDKQFALIDLSFQELRHRFERVRATALQRLLLQLAGMLVSASFGLWLLIMISRAQRHQRLSDTRSRAILDAAPDALLIADEAGVIVLVNKAAGQLYGDGKVLTGMSLVELVPPDARATLRQTLVALLAAGVEEGNHAGRELQGVRLDGSIFPSEFSCSSVESAGARQIIMVVRDITDRRRLEKQLGQSQKMEAVGQLTGGIAHDFNNLLGVIVGNLDLLERALVMEPAALRRVQTAQKAALRGADLTRRLLAFSRKQHLEPAPLNLAEAVANVVAMAERTLGRDIVISTCIDADLPLVQADAAALENVLLNLAVNARDAMPEGGSIVIEAAPIVLDARDPLVNAGELPAGSYASLRVTDTGSGIPRDKLNKVFEPFFTTKEPGKGTGLGLAMVYGFARQSGGNVKIYSEVGVGTSVTLVLPLAEATADQAHSLSAVVPEHHAKPGAVALVVDDEADLLEIAASYLKEMGYRVLTAGDAPAALNVMSAEPRIDLLVTDVMMPGGMNGVTLAQEVRSRQDEIRIIFTSGFPSQALSRRKGTTVDGPLLNKPFVWREFTRVVSQVMEGDCA